MQIKIRLWDGQKMITESSAFEGTGSGAFEYCLGLYGTPLIFSVHGFVPSKTIAATVMLCSNLKDKNNKDVYASDIIACSGKKGKVVFDSGCFMIEWIENPDELIDRDGFMDILWFDREHKPRVVEVLGNEFENPELLEYNA
jgi:hypothetical protein